MNFVFDYEMLYLGGGLTGLILINILIGSIDGLLQRKFDITKFVSGIIKGAVVSISFIGVYVIGIFNPSITLEILGQELTLPMAVYMIVLGGFLWYAYEVLRKLAGFVKAKFE